MATRACAPGLDVSAKAVQAGPCVSAQKQAPEASLRERAQPPGETSPEHHTCCPRRTAAPCPSDMLQPLYICHAVEDGSQAHAVEDGSQAPYAICLCSTLCSRGWHGRDAPGSASRQRLGGSHQVDALEMDRPRHLTWAFVMASLSK